MEELGGKRPKAKRLRVDSVGKFVTIPSGDDMEPGENIILVPADNVIVSSGNVSVSTASGTLPCNGTVRVLATCNGTSSNQGHCQDSSITICTGSGASVDHSYSLRASSRTEIHETLAQTMTKVYSLYDALRYCVHACELCDQTFLGKQNLNNHLTEKHTKAFECPFECSATFSSKSNLKKHVSKIHGV